MEVYQLLVLAPFTAVQMLLSICIQEVVVIVIVSLSEWYNNNFINIS